MGSPLDPDKIKSLLAKKPPTGSGRTGGGTRTPKDPTMPRELSTWWKLDQRFGSCENPDCVDTRPQRVEEGNTMVSEVKSKTICRICFIDGYLITDD